MATVIIKLEADISTDDIYPGRYMATVLPTETPQYCFANRTDLNEKLKSGAFPRGSVIVAGQNFGCGSSREQAASALKGYELGIVARSMSRIFLQNAINLGLNVVLCPSIEAEEGDDLDLQPDRVQNLTTGRTFDVVRLPQARQSIIDAGGLIPYTRQRLLETAR